VFGIHTSFMLESVGVVRLGCTMRPGGQRE
jgi:hypothetical protein